MSPSTTSTATQSLPSSSLSSWQPFQTNPSTPWSISSKIRSALKKTLSTQLLSTSNRQFGVLRVVALLAMGSRQGTSTCLNTRASWAPTRSDRLHQTCLTTRTSPASLEERLLASWPPQRQLSTLRFAATRCLPKLPLSRSATRGSRLRAIDLQLQNVRPLWTVLFGT